MGIDGDPVFLLYSNDSFDKYATRSLCLATIKCGCWSRFFFFWGGGQIVCVVSMVELFGSQRTRLASIDICVWGGKAGRDWCM